MIMIFFKEKKNIGLAFFSNLQEGSQNIDPIEIY